MPDEDKQDQNKGPETDAEKDADTGAEKDSKADTEKDANADDEQDEKSADEQQESDEDADDEEFDAKRAKDKIAKANNEAKNLRARLKDAEDKLKAAKSPEEVDQIVAQMTKDREKETLDLLKENVALKYKLDAKLQKRLSGTTREELEADAKELADLFGASDDEPGDLEGGLEPRKRGGGSSSDPRELAAQYGSRRRKR